MKLSSNRPICDSSDSSDLQSVYIVGVCGGSGSGKTVVCKSLIDLLPKHIRDRSQILSMDCFYRILTQTQQQQARQSAYNFDHPDALDIDRFEKVVQTIKQGKQISIKDYDFVTHTLTKEDKYHFDGKYIDVLFVEGIHVFQRPELFDLKIFVDVDSDERLARRILRDTKERGRTFEGSIAEWRNFVKPSYDNIISKTKPFADIIIPRGGGNEVAFNMISAHLISHLNLEKTSETNRKIN